MFVSRKKIESLEKRIADLEREVQSQQNEMILKKAMEYYRKMTERNVNPHPWGGRKPIRLAGLVLSVRSTDVRRKFNWLLCCINCASVPLTKP